MLRDRQLGDMRDEPRGERQLAERFRQAVLAAERVERRARGLPALRHRFAPRGEKAGDLGRVRGQVGRQRDHAGLAGSERLVQRRDLVLRAYRDQELAVAARHPLQQHGRRQ